MNLRLTSQSTQKNVDLIISNFRKNDIYYNSLQFAENTIQATIPYSMDIAEFLKTHADMDIRAQLIDNDTVIYTGFLRKTFTFIKRHRNQPISLQIVSPMFYLDREIELEQKELVESSSYLTLINKLLQKAGFYTEDKTAAFFSTDSNVQAILAGICDVAFFDEAENIKDILSQIAFELGLVIDFDTNGDFKLNPLFNSIPEPLLNEFNDFNIVGQISLSKKEEECDNVCLKWQSKKFQSNSLIFSDTQNADNTNKCKIEIPAGEYLFNKQANYLEYDSSYGKIITCKQITRKEISGTIYKNVFKENISNNGKSAELSYLNDTANLQTVTQLDIYGDVWVNIEGENQTKANSGDKTKDFNIRFLNSDESVNALALNIVKYYRFADFSAELKSTADYPLGSFVHIDCEGLADIKARIVQKKTSLSSSQIDYKIEAVSEYQAPTVRTQTIKGQNNNNSDFTSIVRDWISGLYSNHIVTLYKNGNGSAITETGILSDLVYDFSNNALSWDNPELSNGWKFSAEEAAGSGAIYITTATAYGRTVTDTIQPNEWAEPIARGENGNNGYNTRTIQLFQRSDAAPQDLPFDFILNFTSRELSITTTQLNGWKIDYPSINENNDPCWEIHVTALSNTITDTISRSQWSEPAKISQDAIVTKAEIQEMINESQKASAPVVYADTTFGGFAVDVDSRTPVSQSVTTTIHVMQADRELEFQFGQIVLPAGFSESHSGNTLTISVAAGVAIKTGNINIPIIYRPYISADTYGDEEQSFYIDEDGENYGYWILGDDYTTYNLGFGYTQLKGGRYLNKALNLAFNDVLQIPSAADTIIGDYFCWTGANNTSSSRVVTPLTTGTVYAYNGYQFEKDTAPSHLQGALAEILSNAEADLETNNSDVVGLFRKIVSQEVIAANLTVTGTAFMNRLYAAQIYADEFISYDEAAKGYADEAESNAIDTVYSDTGINTLTNKTVIQGGKIKTDLIETSAITIGQNQVSGLNNALNGKASTSSVTTVSNNLAALSTTVEGKADASDLDETVVDSQIVYYQDPDNLVSRFYPSPTEWVTDTTGRDAVYTLIQPPYSTTAEKTFYAVTQYKYKDGTVKCESEYMILDRARQRLWAQTEGKTIISGGYIETNLIKANSITVDKIDVDTLMGKDAVFTGTLQGANFILSGYEAGSVVQKEIKNPFNEFNSIKIYSTFPFGTGVIRIILDNVIIRPNNYSCSITIGDSVYSWNTNYQGTITKDVTVSDGNEIKVIADCFGAGGALGGGGTITCDALKICLNKDNSMFKAFTQIGVSEQKTNMSR